MITKHFYSILGALCLLCALCVEHGGEGGHGGGVARLYALIVADGDAPGGEAHPAGQDRRPDPLPGLPHRCVGKTHDIEAGQAMGDAAFHGDAVALHAAQAHGENMIDQEFPSLHR